MKQTLQEQLKLQCELTENQIANEFESNELNKKKQIDDKSLFKLRRTLDDISRANHAKEERLAKLTKDLQAVSCTTSPKHSITTGALAFSVRDPDSIREEIKQVEDKISEELYNQTSLDFMKNRIERERLVHYERLLEFRKIATRLNANFEEAKRTEASSFNHLTVVKNDVIHFHRARDDMRAIYDEEIRKHREVQRKESTKAQEAIERMSYKTILESERFIENKQRLELLEKKASSVRERAEMLSRETTKIGRYRNLLRNIVPIAVGNGFTLDPDASDFDSLVRTLLKLYSVLRLKKASLELRFTEISEDHAIKRSQCDTIKEELARLMEENNDLMDYKSQTIYSASDLKDQIRLLRERLKLKQLTARENEILLAKLFLELFQLSSKWIDVIKTTVSEGEVPENVSNAVRVACDLIDQLKRSFRLEGTPSSKARSLPRMSKITSTPFITEVDMIKQTEASIKKVFSVKFPKAADEVFYLAHLLSTSDVVCLFISPRELDLFLHRYSTIEEASMKIGEVFVQACSNLIDPAGKLGYATSRLLIEITKDIPRSEASLKTQLDVNRLHPTKVEEAMLSPTIVRNRSIADTGAWAQSHILKLKADLGLDFADELPKIRPELNPISKPKVKETERSSLLGAPQLTDQQKSAEEERNHIKSQVLGKRSEPQLDTKPKLHKDFSTSRTTTADYNRNKDFKQMYDSLTFLRQKDKLARTLPIKALNPAPEKWRSLANRRSTDELLKNLYSSPNSTFKSAQTLNSRSSRRAAR
mmetsp:Transcript_28543/g.50711  ORF Transcript_28543/g.50711 Transcript_28543/m.50711 type:complete len:765 (-) Transcript_28543:1853-4147(-)